jgi:hypothetical protein
MMEERTDPSDVNVLFGQTGKAFPVNGITRSALAAARIDTVGDAGTTARKRLRYNENQQAMAAPSGREKVDDRSRGRAVRANVRCGRRSPAGAANRA